MTDFSLYLESGPLRRKTMVHVFDLLGCISKGPTTESALAQTPAAIQSFIEFENKHAAAQRTVESVDLHIVEHVTKGDWLGYGDPDSGFTPDFADLTLEDLQTYIQRLKWMEADLLDLAGGIPPEKRTQTPADGGRTVNAILLYLAEGHAHFLRYLVGKMDEIAGRMRLLRRDPAVMLTSLAEIWDIANQRLAALSPGERSLSVQHGQMTWTARRALRRMLEHTWDLSTEIEGISASLNRT